MKYILQIYFTIYNNIYYVYYKLNFIPIHNIFIFYFLYIYFLFIYFLNTALYFGFIHQIEYESSPKGIHHRCKYGCSIEFVKIFQGNRCC